MYLPVIYAYIAF